LFNGDALLMVYIVLAETESKKQLAESQRLIDDVDIG
jgi:hypothetical protein